MPIDIYNVAKNISVNDISEYILAKTNLNLKVLRMEMRSLRDYDSYKVFVPKQRLTDLLQDDFWPEGISYRRFVDFSNKRKYDGDIKCSEKNKTS